MASHNIDHGRTHHILMSDGTWVNLHKSYYAASHDRKSVLIIDLGSETFDGSLLPVEDVGHCNHQFPWFTLPRPPESHSQGVIPNCNLEDCLKMVASASFIKRPYIEAIEFDADNNGTDVFLMPFPIALAKVVKNNAELDGMRSAHLPDAAALAHFWMWLEDEVGTGLLVTEVDAADNLLQFRSEQFGFLDTSFDTIFGSGPNGAIIYYRAEPESCSLVSDKELLLLDSGAQFIDGTTDITGTMHLGEPSTRQKECFTRVLPGHIALDQAVFPEITPGFVLDAFGRSSLWKVGLDYRHGTGHGVRAALNVHEGPQSISFCFGNMTALQLRVLKGPHISVFSALRSRLFGRGALIRYKQSAINKISCSINRKGKSIKEEKRKTL